MSLEDAAVRQFILMGEIAGAIAAMTAVGMWFKKGFDAKIDHVRADICKDVKGVKEDLKEVKDEVKKHDEWSRKAYKEKSDEIAALKIDVAVLDQMFKANEK